MSHYSKQNWPRSLIVALREIFAALSIWAIGLWLGIGAYSLIGVAL